MKPNVIRTILQVLMAIIQAILGGIKSTLHIGQK